MSGTAKRLDLCATSEVAPGTALKVESGDLALAVFNVDGEFFVTDDTCTHGKASLADEGDLEGHCITCTWHDGKFDIRTGAVLSPPCTTALKTYPVHIEAGALFVDADD